MREASLLKFPANYPDMNRKVAIFAKHIWLFRSGQPSPTQVTGRALKAD